MKKHKTYRKTYRGKSTKRVKRLRFTFYFTLICLLMLALNIYLKLYLNAATGQLEALKQIYLLTLQENKFLNQKVNAIMVDYKKDVSIISVLDNTPMEEAGQYILRASRYYDVPVELFIGIANAESSFRNFKCYNPWGIGVGGPRCYKNWEHSVNGFAQLLRYYYLDEGLITPEQIMPKYVGWNNKNWVKNVEKYYNPKIVIKNYN